MPIVSHTVESREQANGTLNVVIRLQDQDGNVYTPAPINVPAGFDMAAKVAQLSADINARLASNEFERLVGIR